MGFFDVINEPPVVFGSGEEYPFPNRFSIETSAYCNRRCGFCPISGFGGEIPRPKQQLMSSELYDSILWQLAARSFDGVIQMFLLNEPTLDKRLFKLDESGWANRMRSVLPRCTMYVSTNGDVLWKKGDVVETCNAITDVFDSGVNVINLNVYDVGEAGVEQHRAFQEVMSLGVRHGLWAETHNKYRRHNPRRNYLCVSDMRTDRVEAKTFDMFHSKGHASPEAKRDVHCARPHRHMPIQWDGRVPLCCALDQTAEDAVFVGDLNHQSIAEVWNSEILFRYREHLQRAKRDLPGCSTCDHRMSYSHVVRRVTL